MIAPPTTDCRCPACRFHMNVSTALGELQPGDWSICVGCAEFLILQDDGTFRVGQAREQTALPHQIRFAVARARVMFYAFGKATQQSPSVQAVATGLERNL